jgi:beta-phosphoglucomutase-like phosphatase (HAD superfamily)
VTPLLSLSSSSETLSTEAINIKLREFGTEMKWDLKRSILGMPRTQWAPIVISTLGLEGKLTPEELGDAWEANAAELYPTVGALEGADALSAAMHSAGIPLAVATSSFSGPFEKKAAHHGSIFNRMQVTVCGDDSAIRKGKPAPDIFLVAASRLGVLAHEVRTKEGPLV